MRIATRLKAISTVTIAALVVLVPVLIWSFSEFNSAKNDYVLANAILDNFFERASFRDQYFLYREDRVRLLWDKNKETSDRLLRQAETQFHSEENQHTLERLRINIENTAVIFHRIANNTETLSRTEGNRYVYDELDKRLSSQLLLKAAAVRDTATTLKDASARRVELTYKHLTVIIGLFAITSALSIVLISIQLGRLIRKRLALLHNGARIVANGDLSYRIKISGSDEFAELALSINAMTDKLVAEIGAHMQAEEMLRKLSIAIEQSPASVVITDLEACIQYVNPRFTEVTGYSAAEAIGKNPRILQSELTTKETYAELWGKLTSGQSWHGELLNKRKNGELYWEETHIAPVKNQADVVTHYVAVKTNITKRKQAERALQRESEKNLALLRNASDGIHILDTEGNVIEASDSFCAMLGYQRDEIIGMNVSQWDAKFTNTERTLAIKQQFAQQGRSQFETRHRRKDGTIFDVEVSGCPLELDGKPALFNSSRDITERKAAEKMLGQSEARLRAILDNSPYLIWLKDIEGHYIAVNKAFLKATGQSQLQDVQGKTDFDFWPEELAKKYRADDADVLSTRKQKQIEEASMHNGEATWMETSKAPVMDVNGNLLGTTGFAQDITGRKNAEGKIRHLAHYDSLTDLPNRTLFSDRVQQALVAAKRDKEHLALMFVDLDKFKPINDEFGHHVGDLLLKEVAQRMQDCVRESDTVARIGGDEFVVLLPVIEAEQDAILVAEKIRHALNRPFVLVGQSLHISSSTGIAVYPEHGDSETHLLRNADTAMYHAKESGRNNVKLYQPDMQDDV